jgi:ribosome maturation factor RimP
VEDYELTVASAGVGQPLKVFRQYQKLVGKPVEVLLDGGIKIVAELRAATPESITLAWTEQVAAEGSKRKQAVERMEEYPLAGVKWTKEWLDFK